MSDGDDGVRYDDPRPEEGDQGALREDGPGSRGGAPFDPTPYMRQLRGRGGAQDYLDVKWRLLWLRREHPDAEITTEHVRIDENSAIFKATVVIPSGGKATGYGSETARDFGDFIEKAETKAIGRALNALGYGAQFAEGEEEPVPAGGRPAPSRPAPTPAPSPAPPEARDAERAAPTPEPAASPAPAPAPAPAAPRPQGATPIDFVASRNRAGGAPSPSAPVSTPPAETARPGSEAEGSDAGEPDLADYSYTAFWRWARGLGYRSKAEVEELIGRPLTGLSPAEVRNLVRAARGEE